MSRPTDCIFCYKDATARSRTLYRLIPDLLRPGNFVKMYHSENGNREPWRVCDDHKEALKFTPMVELKKEHRP